MIAVFLYNDNGTENIQSIFRLYVYVFEVMEMTDMCWVEPSMEDEIAVDVSMLQQREMILGFIVFQIFEQAKQLGGDGMQVGLEVWFFVVGETLTRLYCGMLGRRQIEDR